jgi:hypothetical protein
MIGDSQTRWEEGVKSFDEEDVSSDRLVGYGSEAQRGWCLKEIRLHGQCELRSYSGFEQKNEKSPVMA